MYNSLTGTGGANKEPRCSVRSRSCKRSDLPNWKPLRSLPARESIVEKISRGLRTLHGNQAGVRDGFS